MQHHDTGKQRLSPGDISAIVGKVGAETETPKGQVCDPKHTCDTGFTCKQDDFHCLDKHSIVEKK